MTTGQLPTGRRRTDSSKQSMQFAIGIVIAVTAVLGIEYALQHMTQTPLPAPRSVSSTDPVSQSDEWAAVSHSDPPGFATVQGAEPLEQPSVLFSESHSNSDIRYFPVRGKATTDSPIVESAQLGLLVQKSSAADQPDSHTPSSPAASSPAPSRLAAPVPGHATPIRPATNQHDAQLRSIIRQELQLASADEHEIWLNALRGLAPHTVRQLLRLRQAIRADGPSITAGPSRQPVSTRPIGPTQNKATFPSTPSAASPPTRPLLISRPRTTGRRVLSASLVPERLRPAVDAIGLARDAILNNIANANTIGFKRRRIFFEDLTYTRVRSHETAGLGVQVSQIRSDHSSGPLRTTRGSLDLAIDGDGFFQIQAGAEILFTRSGNFQVNADGEIVLKSDGRLLKLEPTITAPQDTISLVVSRNGNVFIRQPLVADLTQIGTIQLARFVKPAGLEARGGNLFALTGESGQPYLGNPGTEGRGKVRQFCLEQSNVRLKDELRSLIRLQQQLLAIRQAARILSEFGEFNNTPTPRSPNPASIVREPLLPVGPKLSRQPAPPKR